jgi:hypothetical protein
VNADSTATKTIKIQDFPTSTGPITLPVDLFITGADHLNELRFIATERGGVISGTARRQL